MTIATYLPDVYEFFKRESNGSILRLNLPWFDEMASCSENGKKHKNTCGCDICPTQEWVLPTYP
jgi:hypothetical protein